MKKLLLVTLFMSFTINLLACDDNQIPQPRPDCGTTLSKCKPDRCDPCDPNKKDQCDPDKKDQCDPDKKHGNHRP